MTRSSTLRRRSPSWAASASPSSSTSAAEPPSSGSVSSGGGNTSNINGSTFPRKLSEMLGNEPEVIAWCPHGLSFVICDTDALTHQLLPKYFRHNKLTSFQRQLNLYGFRRITKGVDTGAYFHPQFRKDRPDLVTRIRRVPGQGATATAKFLPLYYKDVQNSSGEKNARASSSHKVAAGGSGNKPVRGRGQHFESLASFASTLSHSSSEGSLAEQDDGGDSGYYGQQGQQVLPSSAAAMAAYNAYAASSAASSCCGADDGYPSDGEGFEPPSPLPLQQLEGGRATKMEVEDGDEDGCEYTFIDPPPLSAEQEREQRARVASCCSMDDDDEAAAEGEQRQQLYSASAPARFQAYWQPAPVLQVVAAPQPCLLKPEQLPQTPHSPLASPLGASAPVTPSAVAAAAAAAAMPAPAQVSSSTSMSSGKPPAPAQLPKTFSVTSFSQWLNGSACTVTASTPGATDSAVPPPPPPPPPRPLVKRCSSMNSELWRGWASTDDLTALAEMDPEQVDEIFGSFGHGQSTDAVLHSMSMGGLEFADGGETGAVVGVGPHRALSITAA